MRVTKSTASAGAEASPVVVALSHFQQTSFIVKVVAGNYKKPEEVNMKKRKVDFVNTFEEGLTTLAVYLAMVSEPNLPDYEEFYTKYFANKTINELVTDSLNRIERLKLNSATRLSNN